MPRNKPAAQQTPAGVPEPTTRQKAANKKGSAPATTEQLTGKRPARRNRASNFVTVNVTSDPQAVKEAIAAATKRLTGQTGMGAKAPKRAGGAVTARELKAGTYVYRGVTIDLGEEAGRRGTSPTATISASGRSARVTTTPAGKNARVYVDGAETAGQAAL